MNKDKPKLIIGQHYRVEKIIDAFIYNRPGSDGGRRVKVPRVKSTEVLRLVEKQANGVCVMERKTWKLLDGPFMGRTDHKWEPALELVKVKQQQIMEAA